MKSTYTTKDISFTETLKRLSTTDKAHADLFNELFQTLINNDVFLNNLANLMVKKENIIQESQTSDPFKIPSAKVTADLQNQLNLQEVNIQNNITDISGLFHSLTDTSEQLTDLSDKIHNFYTVAIDDTTLDYSEIISKYFDNLPLNCTVILQMSTKTTPYHAIIQRSTTNADGSVILYGYDIASPRFRRKCNNIWQNWIDLYENLDSRKLRAYALSTVDYINQFYIEKHTEVLDGVWYRTVTHHGVMHPVLGGGTFYLEGMRATQNYGWQRLTCYYNNGLSYARSITDGIWGAWKGK